MSDLSWTEVGSELFTTPPSFEGNRPEGGGRFTQAMVERAIADLDWQEAVGTTTLPMSPALAIKTVIAEFRIPKVSAFAISSELAPYGFYGIEGNYTNGRVRVYVVDRGSDLLPVASHIVGEDD